MGMCGYRDRIWHTKKGIVPRLHEAVVEDRVLKAWKKFRSFVKGAFRGKVKV